MLETDRKPHGPRRDARRGERRVVHAEVRRRRGMDHQRLGVADVGEVRKERERLDESPSGIASALELEGEDRAAAARIEAAGQRVLGMRGEVGMMHALDRGLGSEEGRDLRRVLDVARHPQRQRLEPLQDVERGHRGHARAEIAQPLAPRAQQEGRGGRFLREHHAVEAFVGLGERRKLARADPIEAPAVDEDPADDDAVPRKVLGGRMHHQVGPFVERATQRRRGHGRVHQERNAMLAGERRDGREIEDIHRRIPDCLAEEEPRLRTHRRAPRFRVPRRHEGRGDAEARQRIGEQVVGAPIKARGGDHVPALAHEGDHREVQRRLAAGGGDGPHPPFQSGYTFLENGHRGVREPRVHMAGRLHVEKRRGGVCIRKDE